MGALDADIEAGLPDQEAGDDQPSEELSDQPASRFRYRITYSKMGSLRYTSQLDLARIWERTLRRAGLTLVYSQGFNPRPKIQLAVGLALGYASQCEIVDAWLVAAVPDDPPVVDSLNNAAPRGLRISEVHLVDVHEPSLQSVVASTSYRVTFREQPDAADLAVRVAELLAQPEIWRERREKRVNLRPLIDDIKLVDGPEPQLEMELAASATRGTSRPDEVLSELGLDPAQALVVRIAIRFEAGAASE